MIRNSICITLVFFLFIKPVICAEPIDTAATVNNTKHALLFSIPDDYDEGKSYPLVIGVHYCGGNAEDYRSSLQPLVDSFDVIIACPGYFGDKIPEEDSVVFQVIVDSAQALFNIDTASVYLTGMSCNGEYSLKHGLEKDYPFKGIFPWAPWVQSNNLDDYNYDSDMPTVISIGTKDSQFGYVIRVYDSLIAHGADVNLIMAYGIAHTLFFDDFSNTMAKCMNYLNDTSSLSLSDLENITMYNSDTSEIEVSVSNIFDRELEFNVISSNVDRIPIPDVEFNQETNTISFILETTETAKYSVRIIVEALEKDGPAIAQSTFHVAIEQRISGTSANQSNEIELFPNPVDNKLKIKGIRQGTQIQLFSSSGKLIHQETSSSHEATINVEDFSPGTYIVRLIQDDKVESSKLIIQ